MRIESAKPAKSGGWIHKLNEPVEVKVRVETKKPKRAYDWSARCLSLFAAKSAARVRIEVAEELGVSIEALELLEVGAGWDHIGPFSSWPARDVRWKPIGIVRRYADGKKLTETGGSNSGLFFRQQWWKDRGPVFLPEGGSDVAALLTMGLCAIGRPSNIGGIEKLIGLLSGKGSRPIIVLGERDEKPEKRGQPKTKRSCPSWCVGCAHCFPGKYGAVKTADALSAALKREVYWRLIDDAKDVRSWLNANGCNVPGFLEAIWAKRKWFAMLKGLTK